MCCRGRRHIVAVCPEPEEEAAHQEEGAESSAPLHHQPAEGEGEVL